MKEVIEKMKGRIVKGVYTQDISGYVYHIIIEFHDGFKVAIESEADVCVHCTQDQDAWIDIREVKHEKSV